jgi:hypothetical protein
MTGQERDYEADLSRVLHTTTDQFEPVGDGLTKIRERLSEPWLKRQWWLLRNEFMVLRWLVVVRCASVFSTLRTRSAAADPALADSAPDPLAPLIACSTPDTPKHAGRLRSLRPVLSATVAWVASRGPGRGSEDEQRSLPGPVLNWLRPALAVAGAVVLVVTGVFALGNFQQGLGFIGLGAPSGSSQPGISSHKSGTGNTNGGGHALKSSSTPSQSRSGAAKPGTTTSHGTAGASPTPCAPASPPPASPPPASPTPTSTSPTPTPTASPTPTPTASPSPSTQAPLTSGTAGHTQEAIGTTALMLCEPTSVKSPSNQSPSPA